MDIGSIFLILALTIIVSIFVSRPFFEHRKDERLNVSQDIMEKENKRSKLLAERDRILSTIQELEIDFELGKIPQDGFGNQREALLLTGAETLKQLDAIKIEDSRESRIKPADQDDELELLISARRKSKDSSVNFCPNCGNSLQPGDQFCPSCGHKII